jgi:type I thyroxine 5'-deiodinase
VGALEELYKKNKDRVAFYLVYVREAHPADGWQAPPNVREGIIYNEPKTEEERHAVAGTCVQRLKISFPAIIDGMDNAVERAYTVWPDRLYLVDRQGKVAYKGRPGPAGFRPAELADAIARLPAETPAGK